MLKVSNILLTITLSSHISRVELPKVIRHPLMPGKRMKFCSGASQDTMRLTESSTRDAPPSAAATLVRSVKVLYLMMPE